MSKVPGSPKAPLKRPVAAWFFEKLDPAPTRGVAEPIHAATGLLSACTIIVKERARRALPSATHTRRQHEPPAAPAPALRRPLQHNALAGRPARARRAEHIFT